MAPRAEKTRTPAAAAVERAALAETLPALVRTLAARAPAGAAGDRARAALEAWAALPPRRRVVELAGTLAAYERALVTGGAEPGALHESLRRELGERHPAILRLPAVAQWLEGEARQGAMLAWLLRENVEKLERLDQDVSARTSEAVQLREELAKLREEHRRALEEVERRRSLADLGLLAAGIVHDFNSVLQAIAGHASVLQAQRAGDPAESAERILEAARRGTELSRSLLACVRDQRGRPVPVNLGAVVGDVLGLLAPSAPRQALIVRRFAEGLPPVLVDPVELRRVVINLFTNACQAIGDGPGQVTVSTGLAEGRDGGVWLEVEDDGRGMDEGTLARAFEPFFSTRGGGSGLGLATVNEIVARMHGTIAVWSEPGRGARFRIVLPALTDRPPSA